MADPDQEHGPCADGRRQPDQELVAAFEACHAHPCAHAVLGAALEALLFPRLLTEHLDDPQRAQDLLHDRLGGALELLHLSPLAAQAPPKHTRDENGARRDREGDQGQRPVDPGHDVDHGDERDRGGDERDEALREDVLDGLSVALDPVRRVRRAPRVVIGEGDALDVMEEPGPEVQDQPLLDPGPEQRAPQSLELAE